MLSEEDKQEMREMAASAAVRDEFRLLKRFSLARQPVDIDRYIQFLTAMSRLNSQPAPPRKFVEYGNVKL